MLPSSSMRGGCKIYKSMEINWKCHAVRDLYTLIADIERAEEKRQRWSTMSYTNIVRGGVHNEEEAAESIS